MAGVQHWKASLVEAAIRFVALRDQTSLDTLCEVAEEFGEAKRRSRVRRDKWRERQEQKETPMGDGIKVCRVEGCRKEAEFTPVLLFKAAEGEEPIRCETAMLDVCAMHAGSLGPEAYTDGNPYIWQAIVKVWTDNGYPAPEPDSVAAVVYEPKAQPPQAKAGWGHEGA